MAKTKTVNEGVWVVDETTALRELVIAEGAELKAPDGKWLTLSVNGVSYEKVPGTYKGDIVLTVSDKFVLPGENPFMRGKSHDMRPAICIEGGAYVPGKSIPAVVKGGRVLGNHIDDVTIRGTDEELIGVIAAGDTELVINNLHIDFEGDNASEMINDFIGVGAGVAAYDNAKVTINDSSIIFDAVTRCTVHAGGHSDVTVNNSTLINNSPATTKMRANWCIGLRGTNRATQLCEYATVHYNNCYIKSNGWGVMSIDGNIDNHMYLKDCTMELTGTRARGYGAFAIGVAYVSLDHCECPVNGYSVLMHTEREGERRGYVEYKNGCEVTGTLNGILVFRDDCGIVNISDSSFDTDESVFVVKGSATRFDIDNSSLSAGNGTIFSVMDNDDPGMGYANFRVRRDLVDAYVDGRDLFSATEEDDVIVNLSNMEVAGNFLNSTTATYPHRYGDKQERPGPPPAPDGEERGGGDAPAHEETRGSTDELLGPKNLLLNLKNTAVAGIISAAKGEYREGVEVIDATNLEELSYNIQTPAPVINNGVIVKVDADSAWIVTGTSYLSKLVIAEGGKVTAPEGKKLNVLVDGVETSISTGEYKGKITLNVD